MVEVEEAAGRLEAAGSAQRVLHLACIPTQRTHARTHTSTLILEAAFSMQEGSAGEHRGARGEQGELRV